MSDRLRKLLGILLMIAAIGVAAWQSLLVSCSSPAAAAAAISQTGGAPR
jgi:hypothetical protein